MSSTDQNQEKNKLHYEALYANYPISNILHCINTSINLSTLQPLLKPFGLGVLVILGWHLNLFDKSLIQNYRNKSVT